MRLTLISPQDTLFEGDILKATVPTDVGMVTVLPGHVSMGSIVKPGIVSFLPKEKHTVAFIEGTEFLFKDDEIHLSVSNGSLYVDHENVIILVTEATAKPDSDIQTLEEIKKNLQKDLEEVKHQWDIHSIEKAYLSLQKITADLKLSRMRHG